MGGNNPFCSILNYHLASEVVDKQLYLPEEVLWFGKHSSWFQFWAEGLSLIAHWDLCPLERAQALASDSTGSESRPDYFELHFLICKMVIIIPIKNSMM